MSTGAMTGADAPALRALAAQMSQSAARLDGIRQGIRSRVHSITWDGPDGAAFRRAWDGQHVPMLARVADGLRDSAERLLAEADQQEAAAGAGPGGVSPGPPTGPVRRAGDDGFLEFLQDFEENAGLLLGGAGAAVGSLLRGFGQHVDGHVRAGSAVRDYWRWTAGNADDLNRWLGTANDVDRAGDVIGRFGTGLNVLGGALNAAEQWNADEGYETGERATRAAAVAGVSYAVDQGIERGAMWAGAAIGTAIFPGVGTVVGGAVGWLAATVATTAFEDQIDAFSSTVGGAVGSAAWNVGEGVVDFGGDVLEAGGDLLGDIGEGAADLWEDLTPW